ncbi:MAG: tRNA (adenosine(37)-N6)-dimethylallyltransferase MiaA [Candidatus Babeliaceae bacterium]|jgi:tRNA dimethylallyltransferase
MDKFIVIIMGPTGVGKSDVALELANALDGEIINGDVGQMYTPLTIGTAKPDWKNSSVRHHLFDIINECTSITAVMYRTLFNKACDDIVARNKMPILVGGSGFYIKSLFFPPRETSILHDSNESESMYSHMSTRDLWTQLSSIDSKRAQAIHANDRYRILRALTLYQKTKILPSLLQPEFIANFSCYIIFLNRDRDDLYSRIDARVISMMDGGWINEVNALSANWKSFLIDKKIIGYDDIIKYIYEKKHAHQDLHELIDHVQKNTRNYAKRQLSFWRMFKKLLDGQLSEKIQYDEDNLTLLDLNLYIKQLSQKIRNAKGAHESKKG